MDFVENWVITQTLGEGAYGEVKLVTNKSTGENVAMKVINSSLDPEIRRAVLKEIGIHKILKSPHIIRFYGNRSENGIDYIFMEYAPHGELFDRIEPDVGMSTNDAQKFMMQLLNGVEYLHSRGIAHRDIKPENLLLDEKDNLKISDFGLATLFRSHGKERPLDKKCGTLPYVAPEVLHRPYAAQPADVWSCGIVLVAMLAGELPWDKADVDCVDYQMWLKGDYTNHSPWTKLDTLPLSLLRHILAASPSSRYTIAQIRNNRWFTQSSKGENRKSSKMLKKDEVKPECKLVSFSQDLAVLKNESDVEISMFLSQPTSIQNMLLSTQLINTQSPSPQNCLQKLVRRMTRFMVNGGLSEATLELTTTLEKLALAWKPTTKNLITVNTVDRRKAQLIFKVNIIETPFGTLLDFRLSRGCGLEFKRHFVCIRTELKELIISHTTY
ncbi:serine/threonine-protein kinase grp isoform X2 [Cimex lectularius]|nr:serine/threonine-protein kinase grp isoform X2 [Cimex lectularius]XP_014251263.1 serine/threonine-protein kinase grp isoform X2 [Cimex lectularius]XP_014251265.1 serine/threonine-protein kinase grp isoform X2 [Cimex lectularius]XP_024084897.1 serine/threonine-protein kinase grp isoform X2 [Cimex lectularius]